MHPDLAAALLGAGLCVRRETADGLELEAAHRASTFEDRVRAARHAALADEPLVAPALLLFAGDKEAHALAMQMGPGIDFELPDDPGYGLVEGSTRVPYNTVERAFETLVRPFLEGLELLAEAGFTRTCVHGLTPRPRDEARLARWCHGVRVTASVHAKLGLVANRVLSAACRRLGLGFVDVWDSLVADGYLDPRFDLDGIHCNEAANAATFAAVVTELLAVSEGDFNPAQYELLVELSRQPDAPVANEEFAGRGYVLCSDRAVAKILSRCGSLEDGLAPLRAALNSPRLQAALSAGWDRTPGPCLVSRVRPVAAELLAPEGSPEGVRRALWLVRGGATVVCESDRASDAGEELAMEPGALLVFDPARVRVRCRAATEDAESLVLGVLPRLPGEAVHVLRTARPFWPPDPFRIPARADASHPRVEAGWLRRWREIEGRTVEVATGEGDRPADAMGESRGAASSPRSETLPVT